VLMAAVALLTGQGFVINRLAGIAYPAWAPRGAVTVAAPGGGRAAPGRGQR